MFACIKPGPRFIARVGLLCNICAHRTASSLRVACYSSELRVGVGMGWCQRLSRRPLWNWYFILRQPARPSHCLCHALSTIHRVAFNSWQHGATGSDPCAGSPFLNRAQITSRTHVLPWLAEMKEQAVKTSLILVGDADLNGIHSALGRSCHCADSGLGYMALARATRLRALGPRQIHKMLGLLPCNFCAAT